MTVDDLDEILLIENDVYPHPWTRGNFLDSFSSGYETWTLRDESGMLAGYFLVMLIVDEAHLLNVSVRADLQGQGIGRKLLDKVVSLAQENGMSSVLLEVRPSNVQALAIYKRYGFTQIGLRKGYYPDANNAREDAIVMRLPL
ncbi:MAG TPA: ribosomal protein S18-alanine N-acetyltransferase [Burkholderiaceae bacterium]|jgi:ribosomal-protein-alanine N-acetyltransferase